MAQESQLVFLDTRHSTTPETPSDCEFELNFNVANDLTNYSLSIESVSFPNAVYVINSTNNKIYWKEDGGATITSTLTTNNYTGDEIAVELQAQLNADTALARVYTVTYDSQSKKLTVSCNAGVPDTIQFVSGDFNTYNELGYNAPTSALTILTSDYPIRLDGTQYIDVVSSIGNMNYSSNGRTNILARVPVLSGFGSIVYYENDSDDLLDLVQNDMTNLEIRLLDDRGYQWDLPANANVSYVLKLVKLM